MKDEELIIDAEAPEADSLEQALPVSPDDTEVEAPQISSDREAPEADALEQSTPAPFDEE